MIDNTILQNTGAELIHLDKGEILFKEGEMARYYFEVANGKIKMNNYNDDGKEYIQGIFAVGKSFGEPPLFGGFTYPANAEAITKASVWKLHKKDFLALLHQHPKIHQEFTTLLAQRLYYKAVMVSEISTQSPEHRILRILDYFKNKQDNNSQQNWVVIDLTRQQIADLTGLRVETVIRNIKKLEQKGAVQIKDRKVLR